MKLARAVNLESDSKPSLHHKFDADLVKKYVKGKKILDIGCFTGQFLSQIEDIASCTGIEPESKAIIFAKKHRRGKFIRGSALKLPFKNEAFDVVTFWDVIEHLPKNTENKALSEAKRVLKRNGIFAMSTVTAHPLSILLDPAFFLIGHRHYSSKQLDYLLELNGFRIIKTVYKWGIWTLIDHNIHLLGKHIFKKNWKIGSLQKMVKQEYNKRGFASTYIVARKNV